MCFAPQGRALFRHLNFETCSKREVFLAFSLCASRHNCVHFFDISTPKNGPDLVCFVHFDFEMCFAPQQRALFRHLNFQKCSERDVFLTFSTVLHATTACTFSTSQLPKMVRTWYCLYILTSKCALRHKGVRFFDISTSKSGPDLVCFVHFDFEMCFAPQRRALFRHLNFQKWSERAVFFAFSLFASRHNGVRLFDMSTSKNGPDRLCFVRFDVLRATTACTFSTSQLPKVVRTWFVLYTLTSKCASRQNGVQFFISHLPSGLRTRRFSEPTFRPSGATNHWKNSVSRLAYLFAHLDLLSSETFCFLIFFTLLFSSLTLPISAFHLSIVSEV